MSRQDRLNSLFSKTLAHFLVSDAPSKDALVTVKVVDLSPNLALGEVRVSVLPLNKAGSVLKNLRKNSKTLAFKTAQKIKLRKTPRLVWKIDTVEQAVSELDQVFEQIAKENTK